MERALFMTGGGGGPSPEEGIKGKSAKVWVGPLTTETESGVVFHPRLVLVVDLTVL